MIRERYPLSAIYTAICLLIYSFVTWSEKRALLTNFIILQETGKHENSGHCMKIFLFNFIDLHGASYHLIYNLLSKVHSLSYGMFYKTKTVHDSL